MNDPVNHLHSYWGYQFQDKELFARALTHKSFANELKTPIEHNEKLEFLGDAVLDLVIGEFLYEKFPLDNEGGLSKKRASLVNEQTLSEIALGLELNKLLRLGKGEIATGGALKPRLLCSGLEAVIGAIFLDGGFLVARDIIRNQFEQISESLRDQEGQERDYKTKLQELVQKATKEAPTYEVLAEEGPSHDREFLVCVRAGDEILAQGRGRNKKSAEQMAAKIAIELKFKEN